MEGGNTETMTLRDGIDNPEITGFFAEFKLLGNGQMLELMRANPDLISVLAPNGQVLDLISQNQALHHQALSLGEALQAELVSKNQKIFETIGNLLPESVKEATIREQPFLIRFLEKPGPGLQAMAVRASPEVILLIRNPCWQAQYEAMVSETAHFEVPLLKRMLDAGQAIHELALLAASEKWKPLAGCEADYDAVLKELVGKLPAKFKETRKKDGGGAKEGEGQPPAPETSSTTDPPLSEKELSLLKEVAEGRRGELGVTTHDGKFLFRRDGGRISLCEDKSFAAGNILYFIPDISEQVQMKIADEHGVKMVEKMKNPCEELRRRYQPLMESGKKEKAERSEAISSVIGGLLARRQRMDEEMSNGLREKERIMLSVRRNLPSVLQKIRQNGIPR